MKTVVDRFLEYIQIDSTSAHNAETVPSTQIQFEFGKFLVKEMKEIGITDASIDEHGYVFGTIPGNTDAPVLGLIAHMDTVDDLENRKVKPRMLTYTGGEIILNEELEVIMSPKRFPSLVDQIGETLIVTDGTTILGADDKAGIAEILACAEVLLQDQSIKHGTIRIAFTPDEEVGRGTDFFDVEKFGAEFAYTIDGGALGGIEYENFNAATANITIYGENIHPGYAKNKMKNATLIAMELERLLPKTEKPEHTQDYEGFYHLTECKGSVELAEMSYIIRDHHFEKFKQKKEKLEEIGKFLNTMYGEHTVSVKITDSYYNMEEKVKPHMFLIDYAKEAFLSLGITPTIEPIRGGTDGARLSFMGLPCPNLSTGGYNFHGKYEYISVGSMEKMVSVLVKLVQQFVK